MDEKTLFTKGRIFAMAAIWIGIILIGTVGFKFWWKPFAEEQAKQEEQQQHEDILSKTSSSGRYKHVVPFAADGFSGYSPWRSKEFQNQAGQYGIRLEIEDDRADYSARLSSIADGSVPIGVFTIDALYKTSSQLGDTPATIIGLIDETKGADVMVAAGKQFPNIDALNRPSVKIVCIPDSPSETLARVVMAHFNLDQLSNDNFEFVDGPQSVIESYKSSKATDNKVFVLWEPYASQILKNPDYMPLVDSSKFAGYIVDVIVVQRDFLLKNETLVEQIVKSYLTTVFNNRNSMVKMVSDDAQSLGEPFSDDQSKMLVEKIWWKNTQENFAHFGFTSGHGLQHMDDMCRNISDVLVKTGAMRQDPTGDRPNLMYYDGIMRKLFDTSWHPGFGREFVREEKKLVALAEEEWGDLRPVGTLQVPRLVFARGTARFSQSSHRTLDDLVEKLKTWPQYYLTIRGNTSAKGDVEANKVLAQSRADAAFAYLKSKGVDINRMRAEHSKPNGSTTVAFILGEHPY